MSSTGLGRCTYDILSDMGTTNVQLYEDQILYIDARHGGWVRASVKLEDDTPFHVRLPSLYVQEIESEMEGDNTLRSYLIDKANRDEGVGVYISGFQSRKSLLRERSAGNVRRRLSKTTFDEKSDTSSISPRSDASLSPREPIDDHLEPLVEEPKIPTEKMAEAIITQQVEKALEQQIQAIEQENQKEFKEFVAAINGQDEKKDTKSPITRKFSGMELRQRSATTKKAYVPPIPLNKETKIIRRQKTLDILHPHQKLSPHTESPEEIGNGYIEEALQEKPESRPLTPKKSPKAYDALSMEEIIGMKSPTPKERSNSHPEPPKPVLVPLEEPLQVPESPKKRTARARSLAPTANDNRRSSLALFSRKLKSIRVDGIQGHQDLLHKLSLLKFNKDGEVVTVIQEQQQTKVVEEYVDEETRARNIIVSSIKAHNTLRKLRSYVTSDPGLRTMRTRLATMKEIHSTELTYVFNLKTLITEYKNQLQRLKILTDNELSIMFGNVELIYNINQQLLNTIHTEFMKWPICNIGAAFRIIAPFLKTYTDYINGYDLGTQLTQDLLLTNKKFADFTNSVYTRRNLSIQSLLVLPVQRLPRYRLLFQQLIEKTVPHHVDYKQIQYCLSLISELTSYVNEKKRTSDLSSSLIALQKKLDVRFKTLLQPYRHFQRKGKLHVKSNRKMIDEKSLVYLFSDMILVLPCRQNTGDDEEAFVASRVEAIFLTFAKLEVVDEVNFKIEAFSRTSTFNFQFTTHDAQACTDWTTLLEKLISNLRKVIQDRGVSVTTEQLEHKRLNCGNRLKVSEHKLNKLESEMTDAKTVVFKIDRAMRDAKNEIERLNTVLELQKEEEKKAQTVLENVKEQHKLVKQDVIKTKQSLEEFDDKILNSVLNNDVAAFRELFAVDPTCIVQDLSSYASPDEFINVPTSEPIPEEKKEEPAPLERHSRSKTILLEMTRTDDSEIKLPSNEGVTATMSIVPKFSGGSFSKNQTKLPKKVTMLLPAPSPAHFTHKYRDNDEYNSPRGESPTTLPPKKPRRIFVKSKDEAEKSNPYVLYEKQKLEKPALDQITSNQFVKSLNRLYRLKPPRSHHLLEQEALTYKYAVDRARFGSHVMESEPVPVADEDDIDTDLYFDYEENEEYPIIKLEMLPNNVELLKQMVINLQKQIK